MSENDGQTPTPDVPPPPPPPAAPQAEPGGSGGGESSNRSVMIVLAYLGLLALIPLLVEKDDREVQWHAKHGLVLFGFWVVLSLVLGIIPALGCVASPLVGLAALVVHVLCIVKGLNGERFLIPALSDLADKF